MPSFSSFFTDLVPKRAQRDDVDPADRDIYNPITILRMLTPQMYLMYFSGWFAWTMDAWDFFSVSLTIPLLAEQFDKTTTDITKSITLTLLFRSVGAIILGLLADRYGRKWTLVATLLIIAVLQIGTSFCTTFSQFLACRSLFGIAMGGIWGQAAATSLENVPVQARGILSGILQQGYAFGYLFAACADLTIVQTNVHSWRTLFWIGAGLTVGAALLRAVLPESQAFIESRIAEKQNPQKGKGKAFMRELGSMLRTNWLRCIHAILLMTGFNFLSHGSQDLYPTYLKSSKGLTPHLATIATIIGNLGAIVGGTLAGYISQFAGRRLTMIVFILWIGCFIPLWILPNSFGPLAAGAFFVQMGVQGAWGCIPIYLSEISPPAFRSSFAGTAYQLGNMVSSAASQIESTAGQSLRTTLKGKSVPDLAKVQGILIGVVAIFTIIMLLLGPENRGSHFEQAKVATTAGAGAAKPGEVGYDAKAGRHGDDGESSVYGGEANDKTVEIAHHEKV